MEPTTANTTNDARPFQLRRYFSLTSGLIILALVLLLAFSYRYSEVLEHTGQAGQRNEILARTYANFLWPEFGGYLLRNDLSPELRRDAPETHQLHERIAQMSRGVPVIKVKVYNRDGVAVYSSVLGEIGENKHDNPAFRRALEDGELVNELTHRGRMSVSEGEIEDVDVVSTYIPIRGQSADDPIAVFELYSNVTDTVSRIEGVTLRLFLALWAVFLLLYLALLAIVGHADRILQRQYSSLKDNETRLRSKATELQREILERQEIERALRRSEKLADTANRAKSEFLSAMSHELRTPMNAILGFAQLLDTEPGAPLSPNQQKFVGQITKAGEHLLGLINQVLDLARIESGKLSLSIEPVTLSTLVEECLPLVQKLGAEQGIQPILVDLNDIRVEADYFRLKQVILNLLTNALKYNRPGGAVAIDARLLPNGQVRIEVTDTGTGIPEDRLAELFQPFNRLDRETSEVEGTGIGLALSKRLVESMKGTIGVRSSVGMGSTFWVELPASGGPLPAPATPEPADVVATAPRTAVTRSVLYVEDNPANRLLMEEMFRRLPGVTLKTAVDGERGLAMAREHRFDLLILDINLPGIDGYEVLRRLRQDGLDPRTPVIAVSANAMPHDIDRGKAAGFAEYHTKPLHFDGFLQSVSELLERRRS
jgi:signal transduction histidine kinase/ActR/RegA family two-component response regulator